MSNEELRRYTKTLWRISKHWNGQMEIPCDVITTEFAIQQLAAIKSACNPNRPLWLRAAVLLDEIIIGSSSPRIVRR